MADTLALAQANLLSPVVLFFALGLLAALARSDLSMPEAFAKGLSLFLMLAIGFKGGAAVATHGLSWQIGLTAAAGVAFSFLMPFLAYGLLRLTSRLDGVTAAAVAAHYGSVSLVTFVAAGAMLETAGIASDGAMVAVLAVMETPAILAGLWLARRHGARGKAGWAHEVFLNGAVVLLMGAFVIGLVTGERGMSAIAPFVVAPFQGVLCLFMLEMGLVAGRRLAAGGTAMTGGLAAFAIAMPLIGAACGWGAAALIGLGTGDALLFIALTASASYIAVPAAMRMALPQADPAVYLTLSLAITFPFNLTLGLPLYLVLAGLASGGA
ncbi:MAG: sodium-dependent bicarbonate transport family permease [Alphaproteobacteria bacterium]|nr:sodium-dependent bicarbonate transport family permease [Alphaproteobacteria bacterium]